MHTTFLIDWKFVSRQKWEGQKVTATLIWPRISLADPSIKYCLIERLSLWFAKFKRGESDKRCASSNTTLRIPHRPWPSNPVQTLLSILLNIFIYLDEVDLTDPTAGSSLQGKSSEDEASPELSASDSLDIEYMIEDDKFDIIMVVFRYVLVNCIQF